MCNRIEDLLGISSTGSFFPPWRFLMHPEELLLLLHPRFHHFDLMCTHQKYITGTLYTGMWILLPAHQGVMVSLMSRQGAVSQQGAVSRQGAQHGEALKCHVMVEGDQEHRVTAKCSSLVACTRQEHQTAMLQCSVIECLMFQ